MEGHYSPFPEEELSKMDIKDRIAATEIRLGSIEEDFFRWVQVGMKYHFDKIHPENPALQQGDYRLTIDEKPQKSDLPSDEHWIRYLTARKDYYKARVADPDTRKNVGEDRRYENELMRSENALRAFTGQGENGYLLTEIASEIRDHQKEGLDVWLKIPDKQQSDLLFTEIWSTRLNYANRMVTAMQERSGKGKTTSPPTPK